MVGKLFRLLFYLMILCGVIFVGFAYLGDLDPTQERVTEPVQLELPR